MISKVNRIKNLGLVFSNYSRDESLPIFRRYNLIYGWNGCGKTTFSKLFEALESGGAKNIVDLEYEIIDESGKKFKQGESFSKKIRVFNQDFVENNLTIKEGKANSITLILGDVNKEIIQQVENDQRELAAKLTDEVKFKEQLQQKNKLKDKTFSDIAKTIYVAIIGGAVRNYRKDDAEKDFSKLIKDESLSEKELEELSIVVKQNSEPLIDWSYNSTISFGGKEEDVSVFSNKILKNSTELLLKTVEKQIIARLKEHSDISQWVESGLKIHNKHNSINCEFCNQSLPKDRLLELSKYFNDEDKKIKLEIENLILQITAVYEFVEAVDYCNKNLFYTELRESYDVYCKNFDEQKIELLANIKKVGQELQGKMAKTTESFELNTKFDFTAFNEVSKNILGLVNKHNKKTGDFENEKNNAKNKLKIHYLNTIFNDVKILESDIENCQENLNKLNNGDYSIQDDIGITGLKKRIFENQAKISNTHKACEDINKGLGDFLGRNELFFVPKTEDVLDENGNSKQIDAGYLIMRGDKPVTNLSESEKTAIAFVYFITHLKEKEFKIKEGIVVIDDPISSLDSDLLFKTVSFIEMRLKAASQLFILTHNYDFLNQIKKWFINELNSKKESEDPKGEFFMITNKYDSLKKNRIGVLSGLDELLKDYESEYHYLFKKMLLFQEENPSDEQVTLKAIYNYPNLARKLLECFLAFRVPKKASFYTRLMSLKEINDDISSEHIGYVYNFVNSHSHLDTKSGLVQFDPTLTLSGAECVAMVMSLIEQADAHHYKAMTKAIR